MGRPYSKIYELQVNGAANDFCIELQAPPRGHLRGIFIKNLTDTSEFTFELFTHEYACTPTGSASSSEAGMFDPDMYSILGSLSSSGGLYRTTTLDYPYENMDENITSARHRLYLRVTPAGSGLKLLSIRLDIDVADYGS